MHHLRIAAVRQIDGTAPQPFRTHLWVVLGKSTELGVGRIVFLDHGMDRRLVHRMDAQRESKCWKVTKLIVKKIITGVIVSGAIGVLPLMAQEKPPCQFEN